MSALSTVVAAATLLGAALIGGTFFAFSSFVMRALARVPAAEGIAAMQSINVVVLNRSFLGVFTGTAAACVAVAVLSAMAWETPAAPWFVAGALSYLLGTFLVTGVGNVPLNDRLAAVDARDPAAVPVWEHYLERWTRLNTIRTVAAMAAALSLAIGLMH